jgi:orotate phosphoribosyltransferase
MIVSLNRMEVGPSGVKAALAEITDTYGFPTAAIVTMEEVVEHLYNRPCQGKVVIDDEMKKKIDEYYATYGVK